MGITKKLITLSLIIAPNFVCAEKLTSYVNPFIGTDGYGNVYGEGRITIRTEASAEEKEEETTKAESVVERFYEAVKGDSLWKISRSFYGTGTRWQVLYDANREQMPSPDLLQIGQKLLIP